MDTYFSVSLHGRFIFRTDIFSNDPAGAARAELALWEAFESLDGYAIVRSDRPSAWTTTPISDGWPYWRPPVKAAAKLMALVHGHLWAGMGAYPVKPAPTAAELRAALSPIKRFLTTRGRAAGLTVTV